MEKYVFGFIDNLIGKTGRLVAIDLFLLCALLAIGTVFHMAHEELSFVDALYWCTQTVTTVGYGDLSNITVSGWRKWFTIFYCLVGVTFVSLLMGGFAALYMQGEARKKMQRMADKGVTPAMFRQMDIEGTGEVTRAQFLEFMMCDALQLVHQSCCMSVRYFVVLIVLNGLKVEVSSFNEINHLFDEIDEDGSGILDMDDVVLAQKNRKKASEEEAAAKAAGAKGT